MHRLVGELLRRFVSIEEKPFKDLWYKTLLVDDQADIDNLLKTHFTEIWLPLEQLDRALDILHELYDDQKVAGNFACEIYGAAASPYWWAHNTFGTPSRYFTAFWNWLLGLEGARLRHTTVLGSPADFGATSPGLGPRFLTIVGVRDRLTQARVKPLGVQHHLPIVYTLYSAQWHLEISGVLHIDDEGVRLRHVSPHRAEHLATLDYVDLKANLDLMQRIHTCSSSPLGRRGTHRIRLAIVRVLSSHPRNILLPWSCVLACIYFPIDTAGSVYCRTGHGDVLVVMAMIGH